MSMTSTAPAILSFPASALPCVTGAAARDASLPCGAADRALAGLIAKGHGREACAAYLGTTDATLMRRVVALSLPTPADRPARQGHGPKAWTSLDIRRLVDLWCRNLPGSRIAALLGRAPGGVYGKARWLGLPTRPRAALLREAPLFPALDLPEPEKPRRREFDWTPERESDLSERWFCLQGHRGIARDYGISPTAVASAAYRLQLPARLGLTLHDDYRPERRDEAARFFAGWTRRICNIRKRPFWTCRSGVVFSDEARRQSAFREAAAVCH